MVELNGKHSMPYCADSGADVSVIGWKQLRTLMEIDGSVRTTTLANQVTIKTAGGHDMIASEEVELRLQLHTAAGPVVIEKPVSCLVLDMDNDEFILGKDVLAELGIDVDRQLEQLVVNEDTIDDDPIGIDDDATIGATDMEEVQEALSLMIDAAIENGFPSERRLELEAIVRKFDVWRLKLGDDPPARVPPLSVRLVKGAKPQKCKARHYPPHLVEFMRGFNAELERLGWVYENPTSRWASTALPVSKNGSNEYRQTSDYRAVNALLDAIAGMMPNLRSVTKNVRGMRHFGLFDFIKGFWQLPLAEDSQEILSYMTDSKIYTPTRVPQGCSDAALHFQRTMETCFATLLYKHLLVWIDDLLLYAVTIDDYLDKLDKLLSLMAHYGLKLSAKKSNLYQRAVKWCGKLIDGDGVRHDPARIDALRSMPYPKTAGELQQFVCAANWMRESIVGYAEAMQPLQEYLDSALKDKRKTKKAAASVGVELSQVERRAFDLMKDKLATSATLHHPSRSGTMCLFTDASDKGWSVMVTQVDEWQATRGAAEQNHRLLTCLSGSFSGAQVNWSVIEKEAFPIVTACDKLSYLLLRPEGFRMFCDHRNLIHVFAPGDQIKKHVRGKLLRWAMRLTEFKYSIRHIAGESNVWADMLSRWACATPTLAAVRRARTRGSQQRDQLTLRPLDDSGFVWPTMNEIARAQRQHRPKTFPRELSERDDGVIVNGDMLWVPREASALVRRLLIIAHCGQQGHRGRHAMMTQLAKTFFISGLREIVDKFLARCLLCHHVKGGKVIPRPWGETYRAQTRNEALHWDFLYLGESFGPDQYLLVLKDDASHFCELVACATPTCTVAAEAMLSWHARFGAPRLWISDQGTHFKNSVIDLLCKQLKCEQSFSVTYSPWINGSIERLNRDIVQVMRAMVLEWKVDHRDWLSLVPLVQASLNHTPVPSLANRSPLELFTGLSPPSPFGGVFVRKPSPGKLIVLDPVDEIDRSMERLRASVYAMHKEVADARLKQTMLNKKKERGDALVNFSVGDYVLRSRVDEKHMNKLLVTWVGPYVVTEAYPRSFKVKHLVSGQEIEVHSSRLKFFADSSLEVTEQLLEHISSQGIILDVNAIRAHRWSPVRKDDEVLINWRGLEPIEDSWEPFDSIAKDVRTLLANYVAATDDAKLLKHWSKFKKRTTSWST